MWLEIDSEGRRINLSRLRSMEKADCGIIRTYYEIHFYYPDGSREIVRYQSKLVRDSAYTSFAEKLDFLK